ncbi:hypothetical protein ASC61_05010 [Aeromicrobium sp. Root344]|uniref:glycosyltransferase family 4 protein n=1 Tax=Aeromicrobium sp. Root344 TaxID=1736521 RepID=UPI0006F6D43B|nr:glycosyltransferase family 4 protein [Aeromicrobium sp. Root344]KQV74411.1 hypothetical protein ASC61_05010 [Aeromicrobium sp. Root344]
MSSATLRVAVVHAYYSSRQPSGENIVVDMQVDALRRAGHEVEVFARRTDELESARLFPVASGIRAATNRGASPRKAIEQFQADIVHVHNLFPTYGRTWTQHFSSRLVTTLHNYRPICPAATLHRDGRSCTLCPDSGSALSAVRHSCFKGSRTQSIPVALGTRFQNDPLLTNAARVITLNDDMLERYAVTGVPRERLVTVPNFVDAPQAPGRHDGGFWLYVGRLTEDKGVAELVDAWPDGPVLKVVGSGPLEELLARTAGPTVELVGQLSHDEVRALLGAAQGLFFPSLWPEGLPTVYLEALAAGLPVVAWPQSIVGTLVAGQGTGFVTSGVVADDIARAGTAFPALSDHCRTVFDTTYTEAAWVAAIERVYADVLRDPSPGAAGAHRMPL